MRVTPHQRFGFGLGFVLAAGFCIFVLASTIDYAWYFLGVIFLSLSWLVLQLPPSTPPMASVPVADADAVQAVGRELVVYLVPVAFMGAPPLVFDLLLGAGWKLGGHGPCDNAADHNGFVSLEVAAGSVEQARRAAGRAVRQTGARVVRIGGARRIK